MPEVNYEEALEALAAASQKGMRLGLDSTRALLGELGDPQLGLRGALVAGTNGKGSVCAMIAAIAAAAGRRVALLTKPHLTSYRERISLGGDPVAEVEFVGLVEAVLDAAQRMPPSAPPPTHHELLTGMGFLAARRWGAEVTVCEVGLGGRLDATNVWDGGVAVLVSVGLDHQAQLGETIPEIATEKAAIIKPKNLVVSGVQGEAVPVVANAARRVGADLWQLGSEIRMERSAVGINITTPRRTFEGIRPGLRGEYQLGNAAVAAAAAEGVAALTGSISDEEVRRGLEAARWPGRMQLIVGSPEVVVDAAHNPHAVAASLPDLCRLAMGRRTVLLFGAMRDHDHAGMLSILAQLRPAAVVLTRAQSARAVAPEALELEWAGSAERVEPTGEALRRAQHLAGPDGLVVCLGSIYVVGEVMAALGEGLPPDPRISAQPLW